MWLPLQTYCLSTLGLNALGQAREMKNRIFKQHFLYPEISVNSLNFAIQWKIWVSPQFGLSVSKDGHLKNYITYQISRSQAK